MIPDLRIVFDTIDHLQRPRTAHLITQDVAHDMFRIAGEHPARVDIAESIHHNLGHSRGTHDRLGIPIRQAVDHAGDHVQPSALSRAVIAVQQRIHARLGGSHKVFLHAGPVAVWIERIVSRQPGGGDMRLFDA
jgi:hypothetical protein